MSRTLEYVQPYYKDDPEHPAPYEKMINKIKSIRDDSVSMFVEYMTGDEPIDKVFISDLDRVIDGGDVDPHDIMDEAFSAKYDELISKMGIITSIKQLPLYHIIMRHYRK